MKALLLCLFISGCQIWTGAAVRPLSIDNQSIDNMPNPVFVLRAEQELSDEQQLYYEHNSSLKSTREDQGINFFGYMYRIK